MSSADVYLAWVCDDVVACSGHDDRRLGRVGPTRARGGRRRHVAEAPTASHRVTASAAIGQLDLSVRLGTLPLAVQVFSQGEASKYSILPPNLEASIVLLICDTAGETRRPE